MANPLRTPADPMEALRLLERRVEALERVRPTVPAYTADPVAPQEGEHWVRTDLAQLCFQVAGVTKRVP